MLGGREQLRDLPQIEKVISKGLPFCDAFLRINIYAVWKMHQGWGGAAVTVENEVSGALHLLCRPG